MLTSGTASDQVFSSIGTVESNKKYLAVIALDDSSTFARLNVNGDDIDDSTLNGAADDCLILSIGGIIGGCDSIQQFDDAGR